MVSYNPLNKKIGIHKSTQKSMNKQCEKKEKYLFLTEKNPNQLVTIDRLMEEPGMVAHTWIPSTQKAEAGEPP